MLRITPQLSIPESEFQWQFARSSGPGGQNVNKLNTKVQLRWKINESTSLPEPIKRRFMERFANRITLDGELLLSSQRYRSQEKNTADCRDKLRDLILSVVTPPKPRRATRPTLGSKKRRLAAKRQRSETKQQRRPPRLD